VKAMSVSAPTLVASGVSPQAPRIRRILLAAEGTGTARAADLVATLAAGLAAEAILVETARPLRAEEILERSRDALADLIVIASSPGSGYGLLESLLAGAGCPVLIVPDTPEARGLGRILCPTDFSHPASAALAWSRRLACAFASHLTLLHVLEWFPEEASHGTTSVSEHHVDLAAELRARVRSGLVGADWVGLESELLVASGRPHVEILRTAREDGSCLIALGAHGLRRTDRLLPGSTVYHVALESLCPVLVVGPRAEEPHAAKGAEP